MTVLPNRDRQTATSSAYVPPSRRRMQVEAWGVALTILAVCWCLAGGILLGIKLLVALARIALG